jgi:type I restriction enzyme S subunit
MSLSSLPASSDAANAIRQKSLPPGWRYSDLDSIVDSTRPICYGILMPKEDVEHGVLYVKVKDFKGDRIDLGSLHRTTAEIANKYRRSALRPNDVLVSIRGTFGRVAIVPQELNGGNVTQDTARVAVVHDVDFNYVAYWLRSPDCQNYFKAVARGVAVRGVNIGDIKPCPLPLAPLNEQRRIVAKIEELLSDLDAGVAALKRAKANLKRYRAAVLKAAVEGKLTEEWRAKHPHTEPASKLLTRILTERRQKWEADQLAKFAAAKKEPPNGWRDKYVEPVARDTTGLAKLPPTWSWATVDGLCPIFVDCAHRTPKYTPEGIPALRPRDVVNGLLRIDRCARVNGVEFSLQTARRVPIEGDIIYSRELSLGWGVVVPKQTPLCMSQGMVLFRPHNEINADFILICVNGPLGRAQAVNASTGTAHPHINLGDIKAYRVPLPPQVEQNAILSTVSELLSQVEAAETAIDRGLTRAARLRQSILKQAFEGKLIPQDPHDESASVLLERLDKRVPTRSTKSRSSMPGRP